MLNKIFLQGRLVADPELRQTTGGVSVATFRIACDRDFKNRETGERETDFITIVAWRGTADFVSRFFSKGRMAIIEGRLQIRPYTDRDGNKRTAAEVVADNVYFADSQRREGEGGYSTPAGGSYPPPTSTAPSYAPPAGVPGNEFGDLVDDDGELPF